MENVDGFKAKLFYCKEMSLFSLTWSKKKIPVAFPFIIYSAYFLNSLNYLCIEHLTYNLDLFKRCLFY